MRVVRGNAERGPAISSAIAIGALAVLALTLLTPVRIQELSPAVALVVLGTVAYRTLLAWRTLVASIVLVILFIPMRRYALPGNLPFQLEPYRVLVAFVVLGWATSLLIDPRVRLRRSGLEGPLGLFIFAILASEVANPGRVAAVSSDVVKTLTFFLSFFLVFFVIVSVIRTQAAVDFLLRLLVLGGSFIAGSSIVENRTGYNVFNHLTSVVPFLRLTDLPRAQGRGERLRAYASAEHAIALSAVLVMLIPLALYLVRRTGQRRWWVAGGLLAAGALAAVSRTGVVMLVVILLVFVWLRPAEARRVWPALIPLLLAVHVALPATIGPLVNSFFPKGGLIKEQEASAGTRGSGRIADLGPSLREAKHHPFGEGFGTRIVDFGRANAPILDDQWLGTLLETGVLGMFALLWLFFRVIRRMVAEAKDDPSPRGWLLGGLAASILAYATGMLTYDAFAFPQVTFVLFILMALGAVVLTLRPDAR